MLSRDRAAVARWLDACAQIDFRRVLSQHYTGTVEANIVDSFGAVDLDVTDEAVATAAGDGGGGLLSESCIRRRPVGSVCV